MYTHPKQASGRTFTIGLRVWSDLGQSRPRLFTLGPTEGYGWGVGGGEGGGLEKRKEGKVSFPESDIQTRRKSESFIRRLRKWSERGEE